MRLRSFYPYDEEPQDDDWEQEESDTAELVARLSGCPQLERWVELEFECCPGGETLEALLSSPHLTNLRRLVSIRNEAGGAVATGTTALAFADSIPTNTGGDQYMSQAITPASAANLLEIEVQGYFSNGAGASNCTMALFQDSTSAALARSCSAWASRIAF